MSLPTLRVATADLLFVRHFDVLSGRAQDDNVMITHQLIQYEQHIGNAQPTPGEFPHESMARLVAV